MMTEATIAVLIFFVFLFFFNLHTYDCVLKVAKCMKIFKLMQFLFVKITKNIRRMKCVSANQHRRAFHLLNQRKYNIPDTNDVRFIKINPY